MVRLTQDYRESLFQDLQNPQKASAYLQAAMEDGDSAVVFLALRHIAAATFGGMSDAELLVLAQGES